MQVNTPTADAVEAAYGKEQYDTQVKKLLSSKQILTWILKYTAEEFQEYITGMPNEDNVPNEGKVTFDICHYGQTGKDGTG